MEILRGLGLLLRGDVLTRAAVVLFSATESPLPDFPQFKLRVARFKGLDRDEFLDNRQFYGNAFALMRRAERFLIESMPIAGRIIPGQMAREDTPLLPVEALREALANAFVHRDYAIGGGSVGVAIYNDRLEIASIGDLHFGLTSEALFLPHESKPWNPMVASVFYRRGIIETWGRGTLKIVRLMKEAGLDSPKMSVSGGAVTIAFTFPTRVEADHSTGLAGSSTGLAGSSTGLADSSIGLNALEKIISQAYPNGLPGKLTRQRMESLLIQLCAHQFVTANDLATTLGRSAVFLRESYLIPMVTSGRLVFRHPESPNHPEQAYRTTRSDFKSE